MDRQSHFPTAVAAPDQGAAPFTFEVGPFVEARKQAWECIGTLKGQRPARSSRVRVRPTPGRAHRESHIIRRS